MIYSGIIHCLKQMTSNSVDSVSGDSLSLREVQPMWRTRSYKEIIVYSRVRQDLNIKTLKAIVMARILYPKWKAEDIGPYLTYQYEGKPRIYISKETGRFYSTVDNDTSRLQAYLLARMLVKFGYIVGYKRTRVYRNRMWLNPHSTKFSLLNAMMMRRASSSQI